MKNPRKNQTLEAVFKELNKTEMQEFQRHQQEQSQVTVGCKNFSGDIELCAVLCTGMHCDSGFTYGGKKGPIFCTQLLKCKGFVGDPSGCTAFVVKELR